MVQLELTRIETGPSETIGVLTINKKLVCFILEPPKKGNKKGVSCIPTGQYLCKRYESKKFGCPCLAVHNVHSREYIAMHYGNTAKDTKGCLLPGLFVGHLDGRRAVLRSKDALKEIIESMNGAAWLTIREGF
jgi:hypothetical protein